MHKVGIIGCGGISASHYDGFTQTGRARVTSVFDTNAEAARAMAEKWSAEAAASAAELVDKVDIVTIATPGFAHREYVELAAAAGRAIVCEKPIALNLDDALAIQAAVDRHDVICMIAFNRRYEPGLLQLREVQDSGRLGGTVSAWVHRYAPASSARWRQIQATGHWRASMERSGGRINEFCSHDVDWLLWTLGRPKSVFGRALYVTEGFSLDDADYALIQCENGVGLLEVHRHAGVAAGGDCGVLGHGGSAVIAGDRMTLTLMDETPAVQPVGHPGRSKHAHFLDCLETKREPLTNVAGAIDVLKVCLAFNRSAASGRAESI